MTTTKHSIGPFWLLFDLLHQTGMKINWFKKPIKYGTDCQFDSMILIHFDLNSNSLRHFSDMNFLAFLIFLNCIKYLNSRINNFDSVITRIYSVKDASNWFQTVTSVFSSLFELLILWVFEWFIRVTCSWFKLWLWGHKS